MVLCIIIHLTWRITDGNYHTTVTLSHLFIIKTRLYLRKFAFTIKSIIYVFITKQLSSLSPVLSHVQKIACRDCKMVYFCIILLQVCDVFFVFSSKGGSQISSRGIRMKRRSFKYAVWGLVMRGFRSFKCLPNLIKSVCALIWCREKWWHLHVFAAYLSCKELFY